MLSRGAARHPDDPVLHLNLGDRAAAARAGSTRDGSEYEWRFRAGAAQHAAMQSAAMEWRGPRRPDTAGPGRAGHGRYHPVLPLRADGGRATDESCSRCSRACGVCCATSRAPQVVDGRRRAAAVRHLVSAAQPAAPARACGRRCRHIWPPTPTGLPRGGTGSGTHGRRIGIAWQGNPVAAAETRPLDPAAASSCRWRRCRACG